MIHLQLTLFSIIVIGIILKRRGIISESGQKTLSDLTINLILPCNIIESFVGGIEISNGLVRNCGYALVISLFIQCFSIFMGRYVFAGFTEEKRKIFIYGLIVTNSSFIGIPIINAIYGNVGVLYTSFFQIPVRVTMWTAGLKLFTDVDEKEAFRKVIFHPCIVAMGIGMALMFLPFEVPVFINNTLISISKCMIPVSMLAIGAMLSESKIKQLFDLSVLYYSGIRLVVYPLLMGIILNVLQLDTILINVTVLLTGMPMAGTTAILADKYGSDSRFASQVIFVSTLLSIATLPMLGAG